MLICGLGLLLVSCPSLPERLRFRPQKTPARRRRSRHQIVIGESIYSEMEAKGDGDENAIETTVIGVSKVVTPATFGVTTTIAAFLPLTQVSGRLGNVLGQIATTVIFCLIFSLMESKLVLPAHLAQITVMKTSDEAKEESIVAEVRRLKEENAAEYGYDIRAIGAAARRHQQEHPERIVSREVPKVGE